MYRVIHRRPFATRFRGSREFVCLRCCGAVFALCVAQVFLAEDCSTAEEVAVKIVSKKTCRLPPRLACAAALVLHSRSLAASIE